MRLRWLVAATAMLVLGAPASAAFAEPGLTVSGLRKDAGLVEFYLSAQELPAGTTLDQVVVSVDGMALTSTAEEVVSMAAGQAPRRAVILVIDTSGSMTGSAMAAARAAANTYLARLPDDVRVGLVSAGAPAKVVLKPTLDRVAAAAAVDSLTAAGETALYDGVRQAVSLIEKGEWVQRRVVLMSDGADTSSQATLSSARKAALAAKIAVDTIAFQTEDSTADILDQLTEGTTGSTYQAADEQALQRAFAAAAGSFSIQLLVQVTVPVEMSGKEVRLAISAGGVSTELPLRFAVDTNAAEPLVGVPAPRPSPVFLLIVIAIVFAGALIVGLILLRPAISGVSQAPAMPDAFALSTSQAPVQGQVAQAALALSAQLVKSTHAESRMAQQLDRAGLRLRPHEWLLVRALVCVVLLALISALGGFALGVAIGPLLGIVLTALYHRNRASKRVQAFADGLPDVLQLIIGSLRAGFSLNQAIDSMIKESQDPMSTEFGRALGETRLGVELTDALERLADRMQSRDLHWAVVAVRVQRDIGGNLAEVLTTTVETMRERDSLRRHARSLSAEGRLSAWILLALPIGVGAFMFTFRGKYVEPLYTHPLGIAMSIIGVLLLLVGGFWMSRLVKVEV